MDLNMVLYTEPILDYLKEEKDQEKVRKKVEEEKNKDKDVGEKLVSSNIDYKWYFMKFS